MYSGRGEGERAGGRVGRVMQGRGKGAGGGGGGRTDKRKHRYRQNCSFLGEVHFSRLHPILRMYL